MNGVGSLLVFLAVSFAVAASGMLFRPGEWYAELTKPSWTPPSWLFGPVWTVLYLMIAIAGWLVWRSAAGARLVWPLALFGTQMAFNGLWSAFFFGLHRIDLALVDITLLWLSIAGTIVAFARLQTSAAVLLVPYLLWVSFAAVLNFSIWRLNSV